jgi:hypothetical protein
MDTKTPHALLTRPHPRTQHDYDDVAPSTTDHHDDDCDCAACLIATGRAIDATHYYIESTTGRLIG